MVEKDYRINEARKAIEATIQRSKDALDAAKNKRQASILLRVLTDMQMKEREELHVLMREHLRKLRQLLDKLEQINVRHKNEETLP
jgi:hypothetical protein